MSKPDQQIIEVEKTRVACDGGAGGHPRVWLQIADGETSVECPYCDAKHVLKPGAGH